MPPIGPSAPHGKYWRPAGAKVGHRHSSRFTLRARRPLVLANNLATTCSGYVPEFPNAPIDLGAAAHQCHHWLGLEIPTQWNPALALAFGALAGVFYNAFEARTPPPAPDAG